jgi:hypothetical protein
MGGDLESGKAAGAGAGADADSVGASGNTCTSLGFVFACLQ